MQRKNTGVRAGAGGDGLQWVDAVDAARADRTNGDLIGVNETMVVDTLLYFFLGDYSCWDRDGHAAVDELSHATGVRGELLRAAADGLRVHDVFGFRRGSGGFGVALEALVSLRIFVAAPGFFTESGAYVVHLFFRVLWAPRWWRLDFRFYMGSMRHQYWKNCIGVIAAAQHRNSDRVEPANMQPAARKFMSCSQSGCRRHWICIPTWCRRCRCRSSDGVVGDVSEILWDGIAIAAIEFVGASLPSDPSRVGVANPAALFWRVRA